MLNGRECCDVWDNQFEALLRQHLPFLEADQQISADLKLREYGLDSLGVVDLLLAVESAYDVSLRDDVLNAETFATPEILWSTITGLQATAS